MKSKRRYLQFSLGTMLLAVTVLYIWLGVHVKWIRDRQEARRWLERHFCFAIGDDGVVNGVKISQTRAPRPLELFGEHGIWWIILDEQSCSLDELKSADRRMRRLFPEADVDVFRFNGGIDRRRREAESNARRLRAMAQAPQTSEH